ncbi:hypothetical protein BJX68DRAFT_260753 [Aspergillus pseudodeflectus]|uniref:DUF2264 domain protein n=1 Tax=Aspergillus pseudodeflectus TaxID=176178 RepID=A0ABR4LBR3_9EURO
MPPLPGFSDNPLRTREDVVRASRALIAPLLPYFSPACARIHIPVAVGTHFDETAAELEGFARPLFVVASLLHAGASPLDELLQPWVHGFAAGTDPEHAEYWGPISDRDQRMVEAEMVAFALLAAPREGLWDRFDARTKTNVANWLRSIQGKQMHVSNWLWFRVMASVALIKVCGVAVHELQEEMEQDLAQLDAMYLSHGWSSDGIWPNADEVLATEEELFKAAGKRHQRFWSRQADYYSGSFAIQFSQLLYVKFAADLDPQRAEKYRQQAREFGQDFWRYFDEQGAAIPFGRSLTYRFACAGFFAALALAEVDCLPSPLDKPGTVKGLLLRHVRWWAKRSTDIFHADGTLNIGWLYPNMFLSEGYTSSQSVYWALKSLVVVALSSTSSFWTEPESDHPQTTASPVLYLAAPRQILCNHPAGNHHFLLNPSQYLKRAFKNTTAKYSKFAYSSAFPFSLTVGATLPAQIAPDNALLLSRDGTETWATKTLCTDARVGTARVRVHFRDYDPAGQTCEELTVVSAQWYPWADRQVSVTTTLVPPSGRWPDWHVRVHRITVRGQGLGTLHTIEGGFAIEKDPRPQHQQPQQQQGTGLAGAGAVGGGGGAVAFTRAGASGISTETPVREPRPDTPPRSPRTMSPTSTVQVIDLEANTNLAAPRTVCPVIEHAEWDVTAGAEVWLVTKVFAISSEANGRRQLQLGGGRTVQERWLDQPQVRIGSRSGGSCAEGPGDYIELSKDIL